MLSSIFLEQYQKRHSGSQSRLQETELNVARATKSELKSEWQSLVYNISQIQYSLFFNRRIVIFTWPLFLVQPWSCCKLVSLIFVIFCVVDLFSWVPRLSLWCCLWWGIFIESFVCTYSFETINFTSAFEIVVTVCLSICLKPISTHYIFGYRRMSVFQQHQFPLLNEK